MEAKNLKNFESAIVKLHAEIKQNNGLIPDKYLPVLQLLKILLKIAKIFTNDKIDKIIDDILLAISILENEEKK